MNKPSRAIIVMVFEVEAQAEFLEKAADHFCDEIAGVIDMVPKIWAEEGTDADDDDPDTNRSILEAIGGRLRVFITNSMVMLR